MLLAAKILMIAFGVISVASFVLYLVDKLQAENRLPRIPEWVLLLVPFIGGGVGAAFGMLVFHHKTNHWYFTLINLIAFLWQAALVVCLVGATPTP